MLKSVIKGGVSLGAGQAVVHGCSLVRNIMIARLLLVNDFGIAITLSLTVTMLEMISNMAAEQLLIQANDGDDERLQSTIHLTNVLRGAITSGALWLLAGPLSQLFNAPEAAWAYRWLALVPLIKGFMHLDMYRLQRRLEFGAVVRVEGYSAIVVTLLAWPLAVGIQDYSAMLWILLAQAVLVLAASHWTAHRAYRLSFRKEYLPRILDFGWPLIVNSLLMFGIFQGDKFVIASGEKLFANQYSMSDLAVYSVAFALTLNPALLITKVGARLFLPILSSDFSSGQAARERYPLCAQIMTLLGGATAVFFWISGPSVVILIYGSQYSQAALLVSWLGLMQSLRIIRVAPTIAAMARADTKNAMLSNIFRSTAIVGVIAIAASGGSLIWIAVAGLCGEVLALIVCLRRLKARHGLLVSSCLKPALVVYAFLPPAVAVTLLWPGQGLVFSLGLSLLFVVMVATTMVLSFSALNSGARSALAWMAGYFWKDAEI